MKRQTKLASYYATLTLGIKGHFLGLHYRFAKENQAGRDEDVQRFAIAPELYIGPFVITPAYFYANFDNFGGGKDLEANNFLAVVLYKPTNNIMLGLRGDYIDVEQGSLDGDVTAITVNATYYFLPNVYLIAEYRNIAHDDLDLDFDEGGDVTLAPDDRTEEKYRLFFVAVF